jgi:hypothetical protein
MTRLTVSTFRLPEWFTELAGHPFARVDAKPRPLNKVWLRQVVVALIGYIQALIEQRVRLKLARVRVLVAERLIASEPSANRGL